MPFTASWDLKNDEILAKKTMNRPISVASCCLGDSYAITSGIKKIRQFWERIDNRFEVISKLAIMRNEMFSSDEENEAYSEIRSLRQCGHIEAHSDDSFEIISFDNKLSFLIKEL